MTDQEALAIVNSLIVQLEILERHFTETRPAEGFYSNSNRPAVTVFNAHQACRDLGRRLAEDLNKEPTDAS